MANNDILVELKKATEQVQAIASMEVEQRAEYLDAVSKQFFELQRTVHSIISEEGIILNNFKWEWISAERNRKRFEIFIANKADLFAREYGFSYESVYRILKTKNSGAYNESYTTVSYYMLVPKN